MSTNNNRVMVLGVPFDPVTFDKTMEKLHEYAAGNEQRFGATPNPEICMSAQKDEEYLKILQSADISFADGVGILWAADALQSSEKSLFLSLLKFSFHRKSKLLPEQVCGSDVFRTFCETSKEPIFLLGGAPGAAKMCQEKFNTPPPACPEHKRLCGEKRELEGVSGNRENNTKVNFPIVDVDDGSSKPHDEERITKKINESGAKVLFVAFGAPTQEKWIARNLEKIPNVKLAIGVGGSFDFISGAQKRAPGFARAVGLEWFWRMIMEPKKRGKRILTAVSGFPREVWKEKSGK